MMICAQKLSPLDVVEASMANPVLQALSGVFGTVFHVCRASSSDIPRSDMAKSVTADFCAEHTAWKSPKHVASATEIRLGNGATVFHLPFGPAVLVVPAGESEGELTYVVGELPGADADLVSANIDYALRTAEQSIEAGNTEELVDSYAAQLSHAYEEINWLHGLSEQLEQFDVSRSLQEVADHTIAALQNLLHAEGAVLMGVREVEGADFVDRLQLLYSSGEWPVSESRTRELIADITDNGRCETVVRNRLSASEVEDGRHSVNSILLVPVAKEQQVFAWLMLLNRRGDASVLIANHELLGIDEFGTEEAAMAEAAASMLAAHARNLQLFNERENLMLGTIQSLVRTIEARDEYTCGHSDRVAKMSEMLARQMGLTDGECTDIYRAGLLHDIGKVGVPDEVLRKPDRLTDKEFEQIKRHPVIGYNILKDHQFFDYVLPGVRWHHERQDGRGYPDGLKGDEIPLMARIMAVADGLDAMTSNRPYRDGMPFEKAESILRDGSGTQWDADVVSAYFEINGQIQDFSRNHRISSVMSELK